MKLPMSFPPALTLAEQIFIFLGAAFFSLGVLFVFYILISRIVKNRQRIKSQYYYSQFQDVLNALIFPDSNSLNRGKDLDKLRSFANQNALAKQTLINQIVGRKKNVTGATAKIIDQVFFDLELQEFSLKKISSPSWNIRAEGIRELTEMNYSDVLQVGPKILNSGKRTLKEEMLMAGIKLNSKNRLAFLDKYDVEITSWMRINIHHYLALLDPRSLPNFSKWLTDKRSDVVLFSISMIRHFRQIAATPGLIQLLVHQDSNIVASAIRALGELESFESIEEVLKLVDSTWKDDKISFCIIRFLGSVGSEETHFHILERYTKHDSFVVKLEAVKMLNKVGRLDLLDKYQDKELETLINHAIDPLLQ